MREPNFAAAAAYALGRLERELDPRLRYHSLAHTRDDVLPAVERLAGYAGVSGEELLLLRTAAVFHDVGFIVGREEHEEAGATICAATLPAYGYSPAQVAEIVTLIRATRIPQSPRSPLGQLLADADLDLLGRDDFLERNGELREELRAFGRDEADADWYRHQLAFLVDHRYWTAGARALRDNGKAANIERLRARLDTVAHMEKISE